ncbi:MAG TPA: plastocyanin/azurin family copper-binding protein [Actinomycetota bacterium]|nr:plastocyanin/azurin family copper-binding protein [Actinomycetota bacterium]
MKRTLALPVVLLAVLLAPTPASPSNDGDVTVRDSSYDPPTVTISPGQKVRWTSQGGLPHTITADDGSFDSHPACGSGGACMTAGQTYERTFPTAGTFRYYCKLHGSPGGSGMAGTVVVTAPAEDLTDTSSTVATLSGSATTGAVSGTATFGGQKPVVVADDPANDANITPRVTDRDGTEAGVDLLNATMSVSNPNQPELLVRWQVADLPTERIVPEGVRYTLPFKVGNAVYVVQAKFSNVTDPDHATNAAGHAGRLGASFELRGACNPSVQGTGIAHCSHRGWLQGSVDPVSSTISVRVPVGSSMAPEIVPGAQLRRNDSSNPDLNDIIAGYQLASLTPSTPLDDRATFGPANAEGFSFTIPAKRVSLGTAPKGSDPRDVEYTTEATLQLNGSFSGTVPVQGVAPGTFDIFARACFAQNCGYRSLGGATLATGNVTAALSLPEEGQADRSYAFWRGGEVGDRIHYALPSQPQPFANCTSSPCFTFTVRVDTPGAARLRVALDASKRNDGFLLQVTSPGGASQSATNSNRWNSELFFSNPGTGVWTILVRPVSAEHAEFGMRAKLEREIPARVADENGLLPPNLRPTAPFELGFEGPALFPANGPFIAPDDANPPAGVAGHGAYSCTPDETLDGEAIRCLRFSFGLSNVGPGPFVIRGDGGNSTDVRPLFQCVERADGSALSRPAGSQQFHPQHLHNHYLDLIELDLQRADPQAGTMTPVGDGRKLGYSPIEQAIGDWYAFDQIPGTNNLACAGGDRRFALSIGWGDGYRYQRIGNFVDFGTNLDGHYVVRLKIDPLNHVLESDERDNIAYTYIRVSQLDRIEILEYGRGEGPFDPNKQVLQLRRKGGVPW